DHNSPDEGGSVPALIIAGEPASRIVETGAITSKSRTWLRMRYGASIFENLITQPSNRSPNTVGCGPPIRGTNSDCEFSLGESKVRPQLANDAVIVVRDEKHCRPWRSIPLSCLPVILPLERFNGFPTRERHTPTECHSCAKCGIVKKLAVCSDAAMPQPSSR